MQKKSIWQNPTLVHDKNSQKNKNTEEPPQHDKKRNLQKPTFDIKFNRERQNAFLWRLGKKKGCQLLPLLFNIMRGI